MRFRILLSLIALVATTALAQPSAHAQGARFHFEPTVWRKDGVSGGPARRSYNQLAPGAIPAAPPPPAATVRTGSTPKGSSVLGIPLSSLKRASAPARPAAQPHVQGHMGPASFNNSFGKAMPMTANPKLLLASPKSIQSKPRTIAAAPKNISRSQNGYPKLRKPATGRPVVAAGRNKIQSYDSGYIPGTTSPSAFGSGSSVQTNVGSRLLPHR